MGTVENPIALETLTGSKDPDDGVGEVSVNNQTMVDLFGDQKEEEEEVNGTDNEEGLKETEVNVGVGGDNEVALEEEGDLGEETKMAVEVEVDQDAVCETKVGEGDQKESQNGGDVEVDQDAACETKVGEGDEKESQNGGDVEVEQDAACETKVGEGDQKESRNGGDVEVEQDADCETKVGEGDRKESQNGGDVEVDQDAGCETKLGEDDQKEYQNGGDIEVDQDAACETKVGEGNQKESLEKNCVVGTENLGVQAEESKENVENGGESCEDQKEEKVSGSEEGTAIQGCRFSVGELVWAKTLNRPWWPGQIYDPSDASKEIAMYNRKDRVLVAFFGEEMAAWCYPSLVKSFKENFVEMSSQWNSTGFNNAVKEALRTVGRYVESQMTCVCSPAEVQTKLARPLASSSGIREGVVVPECRIGGLSVTEFEPAKFVSRLKCISEIVSEISLLERTVFQSQLLAYNWANGWSRTDVYLSLLGASEGKGIDDEPTDKLLSIPHEVVQPSTPRSNGIASNSSAKKRKNKSDRVPSGSHKKRKDKGLDAGINGDSAFSGSNDLTPPNDDTEAKEGNKTGFLSRERKKSKYLSPPYTNLSPGCKSLSVLKDSVPSSPKTPRVSHREVSLGKAAGLTKCSVGKGRKKQMSGEEIDANVDASEVLSEYYSAALDSMYLEESKKYDYIKGFFVKLRRFRYLSDHQKNDIELGSLAKAMRKGDHLTNEEGTETTGAKEGALSNRSQKKYAEEVFSFTGEDTDQTHHSTALGGTEMNGKKMKKERKKGKKGAMSDNPQKNFVDIAVSLSQSPLRKDACRQTNECNTDKGEGKEVTMSNDLQGNYVDIAIISPGTLMQGVDHPTALVGLEMNAKDTDENSVGLAGNNLQKRKGRDWKEDARSRKCQKTSVDGPVVSPGDDVHDSSCPTSEGGIEQNRQDQTEDSSFQISQGKLIDVAVGSAGMCMPGIDSATPESGPRKRIRKKKNATSEGIQIRTEKAASLTKKKIQLNKTENSAALLLGFGPEVPLPAKEDLITLFKSFGTLNEAETQLMEDTRSAQVVFLNRSSAEEAFTSSRKVSPFGTAAVNYRLEGYTTKPRASQPMVNSIQCIPNPVGSNAHAPLSALPPTGETPPLSFMQQKLQSMKLTLDTAGDDVAPEVKSQLENEIKKLMKKLETVA